MNEPQLVGTHKGYTMTCEGISYCCVALKLRGYRGELELVRAINRELRRREKAQLQRALRLENEDLRNLETRFRNGGDGGFFSR